MSRVRTAGHGRQRDGTLVIWSVSDGTRGRRGREVRVAPSGAMVSSLLLETDPERRFSHLELSTAAGLLTLHPERDGTLHGNAIRVDGIEHISGLRWAPDGLLIVDNSPLSAATAARFTRHMQAASSRQWHVVSVGPDLRLRSESRTMADGDEDGLPRLDAAGGWPLELG